MARSTQTRRLITAAVWFWFASIAGLGVAQDHQLNEMSLDRWSKLREVERHQMQIAEKYYRDQNWSVAADEYDKYLTLYESSDGASFAMLKWSLCQVELRKKNTAINDGFRSVIDYWPESDDAIAAGYYIGHTQKEIGQNPVAKKSLGLVVRDHATHLAGVYAMVDLAEIAEIEKDEKSKVEMWRRLTFDALRNKQTQRLCESAALKLSTYRLGEGAVSEAVDALATCYQPDRLPDQVVQQSKSVLQQLMRDPESQTQAAKVADQVADFLREQEPEDLGDEAEKLVARHLAMLRGEVFRAAGQDEKLESTFAEIAKRFGADDQLRRTIADWYRAKQAFDKARGEYRKFDDEFAGLALVAESYRQEQKLDEAIRTYQTLVSKDEENRYQWMAQSAWTYREFGKHDSAIPIYQDLMKQDTENYDRWLWETASSYRDWSKWTEAIGYYRQSDRFPDNYREMAQCHRRLKQYDEAIVLYRQIAGGSKDVAPWAMLQIGYTEEEASRRSQAITAFKQVCKMFPKDQYASRAHAHLQNKYKLSVTLGGATDQ